MDKPLNQSEREELERLRERERQVNAEKTCEIHGHKWFRWPYAASNGTNYLTCERCGKETTD